MNEMRINLARKLRLVDGSITHIASLAHRSSSLKASFKFPMWCRTPEMQIVEKTLFLKGR